MKTINEFRQFLKKNKDKLYAVSENADDLSLDDEWLQENQWDDVYGQEKYEQEHNGKS